MSNSYYISLSSWIIQDGNYGDFKVGDRRSFALEFYPINKFYPSQYLVDPSSTHKTHSEYVVSGNVIHKTIDWWAIDIGVQAYQEARPFKDIAKNQSFNGRIQLGIDPFFYFERLYNSPGSPPLIYDWKILEVLIQTSPFIKNSNGIMARDEEKLAWKNITKTKAWKDDDGNAEYLLKCERLSKSPRHKLK